MSIESSFKQSGLGKRLSDEGGVVVAETVNDYDVPGPGQLSHRSLEIRSFVVSEDEWRDLIEHG
jgi:hypothetical protein